MKKFLSLILLVLSFALILASCNSPEDQFAEDTEVTLNTEVPVIPDDENENGIHATVKRFVSASTNSSIDPNTFEIVNIAELHSIKGGEFYGYLVDVKDAENSTAHMVIEAATDIVMMYSEGRSIFIKKVELGEVDIDAKLYYSNLELWVELGDNCVDLIGGGVVAKDKFILPERNIPETIPETAEFTSIAELNIDEVYLVDENKSIVGDEAAAIIAKISSISGHSPTSGRGFYGYDHIIRCYSNGNMVLELFTLKIVSSTETQYLFSNGIYEAIGNFEYPVLYEFDSAEHYHELATLLDGYSNVEP